jgi:DNA repair protein RadD
MQLRPRQRTFVDKSVAALDERGNTLGVAPTGAGKTVMASAIVGHYVNQGASAMVLQHRDELVDQNRKTFEKINAKASTGLFTAARKEWGYGCTFAMVATLANDANLAGMPPLDVLAIDEGHHADQISLRELIEARLLVRPRTIVLDIGVRDELAGVRKTLSDFDMAAVEAIMDKTVLNDRIVEEWGKLAGDRQTVIFCSTVAHAQHVADTFNAAGVRAATVEGKMSATDRRETLAAYDRGELQVITNVAVLTEGWDHQPTSCIILLRPSSYKSTMIQMIGRGLRKVEPERYPGVVKDDCIVLDFGTSILTHGSIEQDVDLEGGGVKECPECCASVPKQSRECAICGYEWPITIDPAQLPASGAGVGPEGKDGLTDFIMTEVDLLADSPFRYETLFNGLASMASALDAWAVVISYGGYWHAIGGCKDSGIHHLADNGDRLLSMAAADDFLREHGDAEMANKAKRWMTQAPSDKQLAMLRLEPMQALGMTKYQATCLIQWQFSQRAIRGLLERAPQRSIAA